MAPLRAANLVSLEIGRTLIFVGKGRQEYAVIAVPEAEVKNELALEYPLPPESTALIKRYITTFLPRLGPSGGRHLFPSPHGGAKRPTTLGNQIAAVVREATGHRVHLHLLRHLAAMIYLQAYPGAYEAVRRILGHATASAALNVYVGLETAAAARHFDEVVLRHRRLASLRAGQGRRRLRR
jgi:integrase